MSWRVTWFFQSNSNQFRRSFSRSLLTFLCCLACRGDAFSASTRRIIMATNDAYASMTKTAIASIIENTEDSLEIGIVTYTASWRWKNVPAELDKTFQSLERNDANRTVQIAVKEWYDYEDQLNSSARSEIAEKWEQNRDRAPGILIRYSFLHDNPGRILFPGNPWQPYLWLDSDVVVNCDIGEIFEFANKNAPQQPLIGCDYELFNPKILNTQNLETQDRSGNLIRLDPMEFFPKNCNYKQALVSGGVVLFNPEFMFIKDHAPEEQNWYQKLWRQCLDHVADHKEYLITEEYDYTRALEKWSLLETEQKVWDSEEEDFEISYEKNVVQWLPNSFNFNPGQFMICEYILDCIEIYKTWEEGVLQKNFQSDDIAKLSPEQKSEFCKSFIE